MAIAAVLESAASIALGAGGTKTFAYDAAGRNTSVTTSAGTTTLAWDYDGTLSSITYPSTATNTFSYNGEDARVSRTDSGGTRTYKRDGSGVTDSVLSDGAANYTPGLSERRSGVTKYVHQDYLGTYSRLTDASQATTDTRQYDAFGLLVSSTGSTPTPFGFAGSHGYQEDADSGLKLLGHRYYDPSTGRFLTRDDQCDGRNWYAYAGGDPVTMVDPDGNAAVAAGCTPKQIQECKVVCRARGQYYKDCTPVLNVLVGTFTACTCVGKRPKPIGKPRKNPFPFDPHWPSVGGVCRSICAVLAWAIQGFDYDTCARSCPP